jgi:hypothetical protein
VRIVLAHSVDESALWMFRRLRARSRDVELVLAETLDMAVTRWSHGVEDDGAHVHVRLSDGRALHSVRAGAVLNRLMWPPNQLASVAPAPDGAYAESEMRAFVMSWIRSLAPVVVNAPTSQGLSGRWRSALNWRVLAVRAGLDVVPLHMSSQHPQDDHPERSPSRTVLAVGGELLCPKAPPAVRRGVRGLATLSETAVLGVRFAGTDADPAGWRLMDATPQPDLRIGGEAGVAAMEGLLTP